MPSCDPFNIRIEGDSSELLMKVRRIAEKNQIDLIGDEKRGSFDTGNTKGMYEIDRNIITITITSKLYRSNCGDLRGILTALFSGNDSKDYRKIFGYMDIGRL